MKNLNTLFAVLALAIATQANAGQSHSRYELKNVMVSSFQASPPVVTVAQGANSYAIAIGPHASSLGP